MTSYAGTGGGNIVPGPDGRLWFTRGDSIGQPATDGTVRVFTGPLAGRPRFSPYGFAAGPDGALRFVNRYWHSIGRITTTGKLESFVVCHEHGTTC